VNVNRHTSRIWAIASVTLTFGTLAAAILATVTLDALIERPAQGGSMTTLMPGFVYATATVMKACIVAGLVSAVIPLVTPNRSAQGLPVWGITSIAVAPLSPLVGALVVVMAQALEDSASGLSMSDFSQFSRVAVVVNLFLISAGAMSAAASLVKHERPRLLPVLGLVANAPLIGLFWRFEFYAVGFDQDTWALR
jgi:hypothetical protein